jgi:NADPH:quinone reductase
MKAVVVRKFDSIDKIEIDNLPDPRAEAGEVVIDVKAAEVNYPDLLVISGQYQVKPPLPLSPGKAAAGIVSQVGDCVVGLSVGDRVSTLVEYGAFAEKLRAPAQNVFRLPPNLEFGKAAALGLAYQTAHFALAERARMQPGENVLVLGAAGGVGAACVQIAKLLGAKHVIAAVRGNSNAEFVRLCGSDTIIDLSCIELKDGLRERVRAATGGNGADIVLDPVGGAAAAAALRAMSWRGRYVIIGFASGDIPSFPANYLLVKNIEVTGLQWSDYRDRTPEWVARVQQEIFDFYVAGRLEPLVTRRFPLSEFKAALRLLKDGDAQGKVALELS